uniref:uncharacterized protein isoform X2 n=1 Tax=Lonchura striata TaxID=40157 RepID=UPI001292E7DB|nr:uncharacterized protein LOC116183253 isoform X2 [Lonchura striata domestica]
MCGGCDGEAGRREQRMGTVWGERRRAVPAGSGGAACGLCALAWAAGRGARQRPASAELTRGAVPAAGSSPVPERSKVTCLVLQGLVHGSDCHGVRESVSQPAKKIYVVS